MLEDARIYQVIFLSLFLLLGIGTRDWTLQTQTVAVAIGTCLITQVIALTVQQAWYSDSKLTTHQSEPQTHEDLVSGSVNPPEDRSLLMQIWRIIQAKSLLSAVITALGLSLLLRVDHYSTMMLAGVLAISSKFLLRVQGKHLLQGQGKHLLQGQGKHLLQGQGKHLLQGQGKHLLQGQGKHIFNPANFGIIAVLTLTQDGWVSPGQWGEESWYALLFLSAGGLVLQRVGRWDTSAVFLIAYAALEALRNFWLGWTWDVWAHRMMSGSLLLFALFMITDPRTIPNHRVSRVIWALTLAGLTFWLRNSFFITTAPFWALFLLSPTSIALDAIFPANVFTWTAADQISRSEDSSEVTYLTQNS